MEAVLIGILMMVNSSCSNFMPSGFACQVNKEVVTVEFFIPETRCY